MPSVSLTARAHQVLHRHIQPGDFVIDATAGNGHDTLFLAAAVGDTGRVVACDLQADALARTRTALAATQWQNVELLQANHADLEQLARQQGWPAPAAIVFNLGYLPQGDKTIVTRTETTLVALQAAIRLLAAGGLLSVLAYPGHPEGSQEKETIEIWLPQLSPSEFHCTVTESPPGRKPGPVLYTVQKQKPSSSRAESHNP